MGKFSKDKRDIYYRKAKEEGFRARSAYKLIHIDEEFNIFEGVERVLDLCAAPGSWSQVVSKKLKEKGKLGDEDDIRIIAVDLQEMSPIEGVKLIEGDITREETVKEILKYFNGQKPELIICDGAPDVTGFHEIDQYIQSQLILAALQITCKLICHSGTFIAKIFRGRDINFLYSQLKLLFKEVYVAKPKSSRNSSYESFVVCKDFFYEEGNEEIAIGHLSALAQSPQSESSEEHKTKSIHRIEENKKSASKVEGEKEEEDSKIEEPISEEEEKLEKKEFEGFSETECSGFVKFVSCGDLSGFDADRNYSLKLDETEEYKYTAPPQLPINPPYKQFLQMNKKDKGA